MATAQLLVIGGGIIGVTAALEAKRRHPAWRVVLLEKEPDVARHASGRNSGVLHAGLYYPAGSLKARFAREGNARLSRYCTERGLPLRRCGKLVVARGEQEEEGLEELLRRGRASGVPLEEVGPGEARALEPSARVEGRALYSPSTASVDPVAVTRSLAADAEAEGVEIRRGEAFVGPGSDPHTVLTSRGRWTAEYVLNAAGVHADRVARRFGFATGYRIMPFKGRYLEARVPVPLRLHVYPVPDLRYPFLGVHLTAAVDGGVWVGPTATPVVGREQYRLLEVGPAEASATALRLAFLLASRHNTGLRRLAVREIGRHSRRRLLREAGGLARGLPGPEAWGPLRPGIRAQLVDTRRWKLEDDFVYEADGWSLHVLNAVSPGFTCALPLAEHLLDIIDGIREQ